VRFNAPEVDFTVEVIISKPPFVLASVPPVMFIAPVPVTSAVMELRVTVPEPEIVMFPTEVRFPVGATVVPPEIDNVVPAVSAPTPAYAVEGEIAIDVLAFTVLAKAMFAPVEVMDTEPPVELTVAFVAVETCPEPERVTLPLA
jgi:hypothetical protein